MAASALTAILGQRLVRALCENCKEPYKPKPEFLKKANLPADKVDVFYRKPTDPEQQQQICPVCVGSAYKNKGVQTLLDAVVNFLPSPLQREVTAKDNDHDQEKVLLETEPDRPLVAPTV